LNAVQAAQAGHEIEAKLSDALLGGRVDEFGEIPRLHDPGDVDPEGVVAHLHRRVELERLIGQVEAQVRERRRIPIEEAGRTATDDAVERGDALLAVEEQVNRVAGWHGPVTTNHGLVDGG